MNLTLVYITAAAMIGLGLVFLYLLIGRNETRRPQSAVEWIGSGLSVLLVACAALLLFLAMRLEPQARTEINFNDRVAFEDVPLEVPAENFTFRLVADDTEHALDAYRGKVILLNVWATWCPPCLQEIPELNRLYEDLADEGLVVLSISDEPPRTLRAFNETLPLRTVSGYVPGAEAVPPVFRNGFDVRPTTYVIDREGTVRRYLLGARNYDFFRQVVAPYL
ncbi:TlpA family protein disulfide reductase [Rhodocaloribacter litoris]|uniref:TlpA family protein disulfide reductase n=1 Tax=Rhodocaloribacter litoris TaxID=2558931 RepID=UPI00142153CF|nr:TlpA disulfide reductase family protein [Rhodocaloribacter litoris]QXD15723.1 TlpA family protein disulfide reductase [Rhodocaloribacter litoris]GIV60222.1 MAG: hypothetical protein KatS3mg043_1311 [Rhodothermaceae bacterium]